MRTFVLDGLGRGERVAFYPSKDPGIVRDWLGVQDTDRRLRAGSLILATAQDTYFPDGVFDGPRRAAGFAQFVRTSVEEGYPGVRVYADNGWMPDALPKRDEWLDYEARVGALVPQLPLTGLCGFRTSDPGGLPVGAIDMVHAENISDQTGERCDCRLVGTGDGRLALVGEIDAAMSATLWRTLDAAEQGIREAGLSLGAVSFVDGASASRLHRFVVDREIPVSDVSAQVRRIWDLLGLPVPAPRRGDHD